MEEDAFLGSSFENVGSGDIFISGVAGMPVTVGSSDIAWEGLRGHAEGGEGCGGIFLNASECEFERCKYNKPTIRLGRPGCYTRVEINEDEDISMTIRKIQERMSILEKRLMELQTVVAYMPPGGGPGYQSSMQSFEETKTMD